MCILSCGQCFNRDTSILRTIKFWPNIVHKVLILARYKGHHIKDRYFCPIVVYNRQVLLCTANNLSLVCNYLVQDIAWHLYLLFICSNKESVSIFTAKYLINQYQYMSTAYCINMIN